MEKIGNLMCYKKCNGDYIKILSRLRTVTSESNTGESVVQKQHHKGTDLSVNLCELHFTHMI